MSGTQGVDLDAIRARATDAKRNRESYGKQSRSRRITNEASAEDVSALLDAYEALVSERDGLAADRERAPHTPECGIWKYKHDRDRAVLTASGLCNCWKSAAPSDALDDVKREAGAAAIENIVPLITEGGWAQKRANAIRSGDV